MRFRECINSEKGKHNSVTYIICPTRLDTRGLALIIIDTRRVIPQLPNKSLISVIKSQHILKQWVTLKMRVHVNVML